MQVTDHDGDKNYVKV